MKQDIDHCKQCDCGKKQPIVNRTHWLCDKKNKERLNKPKEIIKVSKNASKEEKIKVAKSIISPISEKQKLINIKIKEIYKEIAEEREHICVGCGTNQGLTHSHIIPRSRRKDLETDKNNIVYHCMECHQIWEHGEKQTLSNYKSAMEYIKEVDLGYYNKILNK